MADRPSRGEASRSLCRVRPEPPGARCCGTRPGPHNRHKIRPGDRSIRGGGASRPRPPRAALYGARRGSGDASAHELELAGLSPMMRFACSIALAFLLLGRLTSASGQELGLAELRIGMDPGNPPYTYVDEDGTFSGSDAEIATALCTELRARCKLVPVPFAQLIAALQERSIDAIVSDMSVTREREQLVDFTDIYRNVANRFVARRHAGLDISPEGL